MLLTGILAFAALSTIEVLLYRAIRRQATLDEAAPADAIVVFGAAQYDGQPSPVFKARLDHAFDLEEQGLAPLVITTGAGGGDLRFTEADVGHDYLVQLGLASDKILTDPKSRTTYQSVRAVAGLLQARHQQRCIAVSDGFHLYRIKLMLKARGLTAYASPAPDSPIESDAWKRTYHSMREVLSTTSWYLHIRR